MGKVHAKDKIEKRKIILGMLKDGMLEDKVGKYLRISVKNYNHYLKVRKDKELYRVHKQKRCLLLVRKIYLLETPFVYIVSLITYTPSSTTPVPDSLPKLQHSSSSAQ